jgi:hypothetical protein
MKRSLIAIGIIFASLVVIVLVAVNSHSSPPVVKQSSLNTDIHGNPISEADQRKYAALDERYHERKHILAEREQAEHARKERQAVAKPAATTVQYSNQTPAPVADTDDVKAREEAWVQDHTTLIAHVDPGNDRALTITMDGDTWSSWSDQDKELHERGIYNQWVNAYAKFHAKKWTSSAPFTLRIVDLTGTKLASYY